MIAANDKIIVSVDYGQKEKISISGTEILLAKKYNSNRRESHPVLCTVVSGSKKIPDGRKLLVHHNRFAENSPHHLGDNLYSLSQNNNIYGWIDKDGEVNPLFGNILVERIFFDSGKVIPEHLRKIHNTKFKVAKSNYGYKKGKFIYCQPFSDYEIVFVFNGSEKRVVKVHKNDIVGRIVGSGSV
jgi:hypothetical protein